jgi:hypothetical protein
MKEGIHPEFDTAGRVERFRRKYGEPGKKKAKKARKGKAPEGPAEPAATPSGEGQAE